MATGARKFKKAAKKTAVVTKKVTVAPKKKVVETKLFDKHYLSSLGKLVRIVKSRVKGVGK